MGGKKDGEERISGMREGLCIRGYGKRSRHSGRFHSNVNRDKNHFSRRDSMMT